MTEVGKPSLTSVPTVALTLPGIWDGRNRGGVKVHLRMLACAACSSPAVSIFG